MSSVSLQAHNVLTSIPSPSVSYFEIGPLQIQFYALCVIAGIVVAAFMTNRRLTNRGAEPGVVLDIMLFAVPLAFVGARAFHVVTHPDFYFGEGSNPWNITQYGSVWAIWEGGIAIFGALIGGFVGAWIGCRWTGIRLVTFMDAAAPGLILAQAIGRFGNWFNQELFGQPTDLPWGLEIEENNPAFPAGLPADTLFHPTFLYESIWNVLGAIMLLWAGKRFLLQWGKVFALYLIWYGAGRIVWESIRIDPTEIFFGIRTNVWAALLAVTIGVIMFIIQSRRHPGLEPSPYVKGRGPLGRVAALDSPDNASDFVDVSEPPVDDEAVRASATSTSSSAEVGSNR